MKNLKHFYRHLVRNRKWFWKSIEVYGLAFFIVLSADFFNYPGRSVPFMIYLSNPFMIGILFAVATFTLIVSLWNLYYLWARQIMIGSQAMVWFWFAWGFAQRDIDMHMIGGINTFTAFICICIMLQVVTEAIWDGDGS